METEHVENLSSNPQGPHVPSRLEGMETNNFAWCFTGTLFRPHVPSRLEGMETYTLSGLSSRHRGPSTRTFPFGGNGNRTGITMNPSLLLMSTRTFPFGGNGNADTLLHP